MLVAQLQQSSLTRIRIHTEQAKSLISSDYSHKFMNFAQNIILTIFLRKVYTVSLAYLVPRNYHTESIKDQKIFATDK